MPGRHSSNNIRLVLDLIDDSDLIPDDPLILFLDFQKAFYTVSHKFIFDTLSFFEFGNFFTKAVTLQG